MGTTAVRIMLLAFYEPERAFAEHRVFEVASGEIEKEGLPGKAHCDAMASRLQEVFASPEPERLLVEYTRLFLHPDGARASPYLSSWKSLLGDDALERYLAFFDSKGFSRASDFHDLPEHLAAALEAYLDLRDAEDPAADELRAQFLDAWVPAFCEKLQAQTAEIFYREFGAFLEKWYKWESLHKG